MKVLVAYMSSTGNTKKVAEAIYGELTGDKEIKPISQVQDIGAYDLSFLGFPTHRAGPDEKTREFLSKQCKDGRKVALFVTHGAPDDVPEVPGWMAKFKEAASGADLVGFFDSQGEISRPVHLVMSLSTQKKVRTWAKSDNSKGQPDEAHLAKARAFARDMQSRMIKS